MVKARPHRVTKEFFSLGDVHRRGCNKKTWKRRLSCEWIGRRYFRWIEGKVVVTVDWLSRVCNDSLAACFAVELPLIRFLGIVNFFYIMLRCMLASLNKPMLRL